MTNLLITWPNRYESIGPREIYDVNIAYLEVFNNQVALPLGLYDLEMVMFKEYDSYEQHRRTNPYTTETPSFTTETDIMLACSY